MTRRAVIAGLGLIGGSIGMVLRRSGWDVSFFDPNVTEENARSAAAALRRGDLDTPADILILATPLGPALDILRSLNADDLPERMTTSVCSVLHPLRELAPAEGFVAGHPLAGSHERTLDAARPDLFVDASWFVDRTNAIVQEVISLCGARAQLVDAAEHDRGVALTSHLPQLLSTALAALLEERDVLRFAGPGLRTFLRLAASDATVWAPVIAANRENLAAPADEMARIVREMIEEDPTGAFQRAQSLYERLLSSAPQ